MNKKINQKIFSFIEYYNLLNMDMLINNSPINRFDNNEKLSNDIGKSQRLEELKKVIGSLKNCELKLSSYIISLNNFIKNFCENFVAQFIKMSDTAIICKTLSRVFLFGRCQGFY